MARSGFPFVDFIVLGELREGEREGGRWREVEETFYLLISPWSWGAARVRRGAGGRGGDIGGSIFPVVWGLFFTIFVLFLGSSFN